MYSHNFHCINFSFLIFVINLFAFVIAEINVSIRVCLQIKPIIKIHFHTHTLLLSKVPFYLQSQRLLQRITSHLGKQFSSVNKKIKQ